MNQPMGSRDAVAMSLRNEKPSPHERAAKLYPAGGKDTLANDLANYARNAYMYSDPECLILAAYWPESKCWYVHLAVGYGALSRFFSLAPFEGHLVAFARPEKGRKNLTYFDYKRLKKLCTIYSMRQQS